MNDAQCLFTYLNFMVRNAKEGHVIFILALILGHPLFTLVVSLQRLCTYCSCSCIHQSWLGCQKHTDLYLTLSQDVCAEWNEWTNVELVLLRWMNSINLDNEHTHTGFFLSLVIVATVLFEFLRSYEWMQSALDHIIVGQASWVPGVKLFDVLGSVLW